MVYNSWNRTLSSQDEECFGAMTLDEVVKGIRDQPAKTVTAADVKTKIAQIFTGECI